MQQRERESARASTYVCVLCENLNGVKNQRSTEFAWTQCGDGIQVLAFCEKMILESETLLTRDIEPQMKA